MRKEEEKEKKNKKEGPCKLMAGYRDLLTGAWMMLKLWLANRGGTA